MANRNAIIAGVGLADAPRKSRWPARLDLIQSGTGLLLALFMWGHMFFVGAVGLNKIGRFRLDPREARTDADYYELIGDDAGVFGCMSLLACHDVCPKDLPLATQIAFMRRKMATIGWK
jgi:hypothetical protein